MSIDNRPQPYSLRIDSGIREKLEAAAKAGNRSLHAEIMMRLESSLQAVEQPPDDRQIFTVEDVRRIAAEVFRELNKSGK
jgi:hypothetical protein